MAQNDWERREADLLKKEIAYLDRFTPFEKIVDNPITYCAAVVVVSLFAFVLGTLIGLVL